MNLALLLFLAMLWCVVLLPSAVRNHRHSLHHSMGGFARTMQVLGGPGGGGPGTSARDMRRVLVPANAARIVAPPRGEVLARERRRKALSRLTLTAAVLTSAALVFGGLVWVPAVAADLTLLGFVAALRRIAMRAAARRELVRLGDHRRVPMAGHDEVRRAVGH